MLESQSDGVVISFDVARKRLRGKIEARHEKRRTELEEFAVDAKRKEHEWKDDLLHDWPKVYTTRLWARIGYCTRPERILDDFYGAALWWHRRRGNPGVSATKTFLTQFTGP